MATVRLDTLRTKAYRAADQEDENLCSNAEVNAYLMESCKAFRAWLVANGAADRLATSSTVAVTSAASSYALPTDLAHLLNVFWDAGVGRLLRMEECPPNENEFTLAGSGWTFDYAVRYELVGANIRFIPAPTASHTVTLKYVPSFTELTVDSQTVEVWDGWDKWIYNDAASQMAEKEESDATAAKCLRRRDECGREILTLARRSRGEPKRVQDVYKPTGRWWP